LIKKTDFLNEILIMFISFQPEGLINNAFKLYRHVISCFRRWVSGICTVLGLYAAQSGSFFLFYAAQCPKTAQILNYHFTEDACLFLYQCQQVNVA